MSDFSLPDEPAADGSVDPFEKYRSRPKQLARWLLQSRDKLRAKYQALKAEWKRLKVRVADVSKSRDMWKQRAEFSEQELRTMHTEIQRLTAEAEQAEDVKKK